MAGRIATAALAASHPASTRTKSIGGLCSVTIASPNVGAQGLWSAPWFGMRGIGTWTVHSVATPGYWFAARHCCCAATSPRSVAIAGRLVGGRGYPVCCARGCPACSYSTAAAASPSLRCPTESYLVSTLPFESCYNRPHYHRFAAVSTIRPAKTFGAHTPAFANVSRSCPKKAPSTAC